jgi:hypothetical protein
MNLSFEDDILHLFISRNKFFIIRLIDQKRIKEINIHKLNSIDKNVKIIILYIVTKVQIPTHQFMCMSF